MPDTTQTTQEQTPMIEQTDPLPAPGAPHAYVAVHRKHSEFADRPEWGHRAYVIPAWDDEEIDYAMRVGDTLLPIGPDGDTGTRWVTEESAPVEAPSLPMAPGLRLSNGMAEVVVLELMRTALAPGLWRVRMVGLREDYATEAGLLACGYAPIAEGGQADA